MFDPKPNDELCAAFLRRRTVLLGDVDFSLTNRVGQQLLQLQEEGPSTITILIQSNGGDTFAALELCDLIEHLITVPMRAIVLGRCNSAATFILLSCAERYATPNSRFVVHSSRISGISVLLDRATEHHLKEMLKEATSTADLVASHYMKKLDMSREGVDALIARGDQLFNESMSAEEALKAGLITKIVDGKLDIFSA